MRMLNRNGAYQGFKPFQAFSRYAICGLCRRFHRDACPSEKREDLKLNLYHQMFYDKPLDSTCFDPIVRARRKPSRYLLNLVEHRIALEAVASTFIDIASSRVKPTHVSYIKPERVYVKRRLWLRVRIGLRRYGEAEAYIHTRNFSSKEVYPSAAPEPPREILPKSKPTYVILLASQLPPSGSKGYRGWIDKHELRVWETFTAFKLRDRRSKWSGRGTKRVAEAEYPEAYAKSIWGFILNLLRYTIKPLLELMRRLNIEVSEPISSIWLRGLDTERVIPKDRGPP